jgi:hypothetical protein
MYEEDIMIYQDNISEQDFLQLSKERSLCISIYLTTSHLLQKSPVDRLNFRHMISQSIEQAQVLGEKDEVENIEKQLVALLNDDNFWIYLGKSLAVLATADRLITYRISYDVANMAKASDRFYLKPLLPALHPMSVNILAISQKSVHLYEFTSTEQLILIDVPTMPSDLTDATGRVLQKNGVAEARLRDETGKKVLQLQFIRAIEKSIRPMLIVTNIPLVLATTEELAGLYRSINTYPLLSNETIVGSVENKSINDLVESTKSIVLKLRNHILEKWNNDYNERCNEALASSDLATIARLASQGQVSKLLVDVNSVIYGRFDETGSYKLLEENNVLSYDLIDEIVDRVLTFGGEVMAVRNDETIPSHLLPISASFRW